MKYPMAHCRPGTSCLPLFKLGFIVKKAKSAGSFVMRELCKYTVEKVYSKFHVIIHKCTNKKKLCSNSTT